MNKYDLVLWDLDGTILDTKNSILDTVNYFVKAEKLVPKKGFEDVEEFIGPPIVQTMKKVYGFDEETAIRYSKIYREHYRNNFLYNAIPYETIFDTMEIIKNKGIKQALATYKMEEMAILIMKRFGFDKYFDIMHGFVDGISKKSEIMKKIMKELNILESDRVLMIGDTINDLQGAIDIDCDFFASSYGFGYEVDKEIMENSKYKRYIANIKKPIEVVNYI